MNETAMVGALSGAATFAFLLLAFIAGFWIGRRAASPPRMGPVLGSAPSEEQMAEMEKVMMQRFAEQMAAARRPGASDQGFMNNGG